MRFPRSAMGRIIGKGGATIKDIREKSGAKIDAEDAQGDQCEFRISGKPSSVGAARKMIMDVIDGKGGGKGVSGGDRGGPDSMGPDDVTVNLDFPASAAGSIIGSKGANIMELRQMSGARIKVDKLVDRCKVVLTGPHDAVERAKTMIRDVTQSGDVDGRSKKGSSGGDRHDDHDRTSFARHSQHDDRDSGGEAITEDLELPGGATGAIIGSKGAKIAEVRERSGAKVQVEKEGDRCKVRIVGNPEQVRRARGMVQQLADESASGPSDRGRMECEDVVDVPISMIGRVIGKGGETVQRLQVESGAKIEINAKDRKDPCPVRIGGSKEAVSHARRLIFEVLDRADGPRRGGGDRDRNDRGGAGDYDDRGRDSDHGRGPPPGGYSAGKYSGEDGFWCSANPGNPLPGPWDFPPAGDGNASSVVPSFGGGGVLKEIDIDEL